MKYQDRWSNFISCMLFNQVAPLIPLFIEYKAIGHISDKSLTLTACMYAFAIGASSKQKIIFSLCMVSGILTAFAFGQTKDRDIASLLSISSGIIIVVFILHGIERYFRHINDNEAFLLFENNKEQEEEIAKHGDNKSVGKTS